MMAMSVIITIDYVLSLSHCYHHYHHSQDDHYCYYLPGIVLEQIVTQCRVELMPMR